MIDGALVGQTLVANLNDGGGVFPAIGTRGLIGNQGEALFREKAGGLFIVVRFAPTRSFPKGDPRQERRSRGICDVKQGYRDFPVFDPDGEQTISVRLDVGGPTWDFEVAGDFGRGRIREVDDEEGIDIEEGDDVELIAIESGGMKGFPPGGFQFELGKGRDVLSCDGEILHPGFARRPAGGPIPAVADHGDRAVGDVELELVRDRTLGDQRFDKGRLAGGAGDIDHQNAGSAPIAGRGGCDQEGRACSLENRGVTLARYRGELNRSFEIGEIESLDRDRGGKGRIGPGRGRGSHVEAGSDQAAVLHVTGDGQCSHQGGTAVLHGNQVNGTRLGGVVRGQKGQIGTAFIQGVELFPTGGQSQATGAGWLRRIPQVKDLQAPILVEEEELVPDDLPDVGLRHCGRDRAIRRSGGVHRNVHGH